MEARIELDSSGGQCRLQGSNGLLDGARDHECIGAILTRQRQQYTRLAHDDRVAELRGRGILHGRKILQAQGCAGLRRNDGVAQGRRRQRLTMTLDQHALIGRLDEPSAANAGRRLNRRDDIRECEIACVQLMGIHFNLELPFIAAVDRRARHSWNRQQTRANCPLHQVAQFHRRHFVADKTELEEVHGRGHQRCQLRGLHSRRKIGGDLRNRLRNDLSRAVGVAVFLKDHRYVGQSGDGLGAHGLHAGRPTDRRLDRQGHQQLDLLGDEAGRLRLHARLCRHELREDVVFGPVENDYAVDDQNDGQRAHDRGKAQRPADDGGQHGL